MPQALDHYRNRRRILRERHGDALIMQLFEESGTATLLDSSAAAGQSRWLDPAKLPLLVGAIALPACGILLSVVLGGQSRRTYRALIVSLDRVVSLCVFAERLAERASRLPIRLAAGIRPWGRVARRRPFRHNDMTTPSSSVRPRLYACADFTQPRMPWGKAQTAFPFLAADIGCVRR